MKERCTKYKMDEKSRKYHSDVIRMFNSIMFETLIHKHCITTDTVKIFTFEDEYGENIQKLFRGYLASKEMNGHTKKYFIDEEFYKELPIRVNSDTEVYMKEGAKSKSVIYAPTQDVTKFVINPEQCWDDNSQFIVDILPFKHSEPLYWELNKIIAVMGFVGKTFIAVSSGSEFGKSSVYKFIHGITNKSIVFKPRTPAGMLLNINETGNIVFDEVQQTTAETLRIIEEFSQTVADNSPEYVNGAIKSKGLKQIYNTINQSITYLFNLKTYYKNPNKQFFEHIWANPTALDTKFLKVKFEGILEEKFDKKFDIKKEAEDNKMLYIRIHKHLMYLKDLKVENKYKKRYNTDKLLLLKGRHKIIYDEIVWGIDVFSKDQQSFDKMVGTLNTSIKAYREMVGSKGTLTYSMEESLVKTPLKSGTKELPILNNKDKVIEFLEKQKGCVPWDDVVKELGVPDIDYIVQQLKKDGEIFERKKGYLEVLR